jgi:glutamate--cysteine ligase
MQTISGIHYNFSLPEEAWPLLQGIEDRRTPALEYQNDAYFALIRNFRRRSWLLLYLFGASPAVCRSFVAGRKHDLVELGTDTLYRPWATSLRMGRLGYQSDAQASLAVSYNGLASYARSLKDAMTVPYPAYAAIGIRKGGEYQQLSTALLQIENEFYGTIRPKRVIRPGERPLHALGERGVEYVEVRCMDLDPFLPVGIDENTIRFLDVFLLHCLLDESPPDTPLQIDALGRNQLRVASAGREPGLKLERNAQDVSLAEWGEELLSQSEPIAAALDAAHGGSAYRETIDAARSAVRESDTVPSARVIAQLERNHGRSYISFVKAQSLRHLGTLKNLSLDPALQARFAEQAQSSITEQRHIEAADTISFEAYRQKYLSQELL